MSSVILCKEVKESHSLYVHTYIFLHSSSSRVVCFEQGLHTVLSNVSNFQTSIGLVDGTLTGTNSPGQSGPGSNVIEGVQALKLDVV